MGLIYHRPSGENFSFVVSKMWPGDGCVNHKSTDQEV